MIRFRIKHTSLGNPFPDQYLHSMGWAGPIWGPAEGCWLFPTRYDAQRILNMLPFGHDRNVEIVEVFI